SLVLKHWVRLEWDGPTRDVYNRHLAYVVREDGLFVNAALLREGLARVTARGPLTRLSELRRAEAGAPASRRGLWGPAAADPQAPRRGMGGRAAPVHPPSYTRRRKSTL